MSSSEAYPEGLLSSDSVCVPELAPSVSDLTEAVVAVSVTV